MSIIFLGKNNLFCFYFSIDNSLVIWYNVKLFKQKKKGDFTPFITLFYFTLEDIKDIISIIGKNNFCSCVPNFI